ncbi:MAG: hypothetical protein ACYCUX_07900 [Metallibacterium sp.]
MLSLLNCDRMTLGSMAAGWTDHGKVRSIWNWSNMQQPEERRG